jgi:hypothetical protein
MSPIIQRKLYKLLSAVTLRYAFKSFVEYIGLVYAIAKLIEIPDGNVRLKRTLNYRLKSLRYWHLHVI